MEIARQNGEGMLMNNEDIMTKKIRTFEKILIKKEIYLMSKEENIKNIFIFQDFNSNEIKNTKLQLDSEINRSYEISLSKEYKKINKKIINNNTKEWINKTKQSVINYNGPQTGMKNTKIL